MSEQTQEQAVRCPCCESADTHPQTEPRRTEKKASIDELEKILNAPEGQYKIHIRPDGQVDVYTLSECKTCGCVWDESKRRPSPPQAFDPGLWWQTESQRKIYVEYAARRDALASAPSPPAPDIAQIRARFEAWAIRTGRTTMQQASAYDRGGDMFACWLAALGVTP